MYAAYNTMNRMGDRDVQSSESKGPSQRPKWWHNLDLVHANLVALIVDEDCGDREPKTRAVLAALGWTKRRGDGRPAHEMRDGEAADLSPFYVDCAEPLARKTLRLYIKILSLRASYSATTTNPLASNVNENSLQRLRSTLANAPPGLALERMVSELDDAGDASTGVPAPRGESATVGAYRRLHTIGAAAVAAHTLGLHGDDPRSPRRPGSANGRCASASANGRCASGSANGRCASGSANGRCASGNTDGSCASGRSAPWPDFPCIVLRNCSKEAAGWNVINSFQGNVALSGGARYLCVGTEALSNDGPASWIVWWASAPTTIKAIRASQPPEVTDDLFYNCFMPVFANLFLGALSTPLILKEESWQGRSPRIGWLSVATPTNGNHAADGSHATNGSHAADGIHAADGSHAADGVRATDVATPPTRPSDSRSILPLYAAVHAPLLALLDLHLPFALTILTLEYAGATNVWRTSAIDDGIVVLTVRSTDEPEIVRAVFVEELAAAAVAVPAKTLQWREVIDRGLTSGVDQAFDARVDLFDFYFGAAVAATAENAIGNEARAAEREPPLEPVSL